MKKIITLILCSISLINFAQQKNSIYMAVSFKGAKTDKYDVYFTKYNKSNTDSTVWIEEPRYLLFVNKKGNKDSIKADYGLLFENIQYSRNIEISTFGSVIKITIINKKTMVPMHLVLALNIKSVYTKVIIENMHYVKNAYYEFNNDAGKYNSMDYEAIYRLTNFKPSKIKMPKRYSLQAFNN